MALARRGLGPRRASETQNKERPPGPANHAFAATLYDVLKLTLRFAGQAITGQSELVVDLRLIYVPGRRGCRSLDASSVLRWLGDDLLSLRVRAVLGHFRPIDALSGTMARSVPSCRIQFRSRLKQKARSTRQIRCTAKKCAKIRRLMLNTCRHSPLPLAILFANLAVTQQPQSKYQLAPQAFKVPKPIVFSRLAR